MLNNICKNILFLGSFALFLAGCTGSGSDMGPYAPGRAGQFVRGVVVDEAGLPIVSAVVSLVGTTQIAVTKSSGRFILPSPTPGDYLVSVDGRYASADGSDRFPEIRFPLTVLSGNQEVPQRFVLPDLVGGADAQVTPGVVASLAALDEVGGRLALQNNTTVAWGEESAAFTLSLVSAGKGDLPTPFTGVTGRPAASMPLVIDPPLVTFSPAATIRVKETLGVSTGQNVPLYRLNPTTGVWQQLGNGVVNAGGYIEAGALAPGGGIYLFSVSRPAGESTYLQGVVKNVAGNPVANAWVHGNEGLAVVSDSTGAFSLGPLAPKDGSGAARTVRLTIRAGGGWLPARLAGDHALSTTGDTDLGTLTLDTLPGATLQILGILEGRAAPWRLGNGGALDFACQGRASQEGAIEWEDMPLGFTHARFGFIEHGNWHHGFRELDLATQDGVYQFHAFINQTDARPDHIDRSMVVQPVYVNGGVVPGAGIFLGLDPGTSSYLTGDEFGQAWFYGMKYNQIVTAFKEQTLAGQTLRAATTYYNVNNNTLDMPLACQSRSRGSSYIPFGEYAVTLQGAGAGTTGVVGRAQLRKWDVIEALLEGSDLAAEAPQRSLVIGVPAGSGSLVGWEVNGSTQLQRLGFATGLTTTAGTRVTNTLALDQTAVADTLRLSGLLNTRETNIPAASFTFGLGYQFSGGDAVLVRRELVPTVSSGDLLLQVPPLTGALANAEYIIGVTGSATVSGKTYTQKAIVQGTGATQTPSFLGDDTGVSGDHALDITAPAAGSTVDPANLQLTWTVPAGTTVLRLRATWSVGSVEGEWNIWLRPEQTTFTFFGLPSNGFVFFPGSGESVNLALTAYRHEGSDLAEAVEFDRFLGAIGYTDPLRLGVTAISSVSLAVTMQ